MIPDGAGGALIAWADMRRGAEPDIYAQRVTASGAIAPGWRADGVPVSVGSGFKRDPVLASDGAAGAVIAWWVNQGNGSNQALAQRVTFDGSIAGGWPSNGLALGRISAGKLYPVIVGDGSGGAVVAWNDSSASDGAQVMAQRVAGTGVIPAGWNHNGVPLTNTSGPKLVTGIVSDEQGGGALVVWMDGRNGTDWDIYAQRVTGGGVVGPNYSSLRWPGWIVRSYPNPASQSLRIEVISMGVPAVVELFDVQGRLLRSQDYGIQPLGKLTLDVSVTGLASGIYYVRYRDSKAALSIGLTRVVVVR